MFLTYLLLRTGEELLSSSQLKTISFLYIIYIFLLQIYNKTDLEECVNMAEKQVRMEI